MTIPRIGITGNTTDPASTEPGRIVLGTAYVTAVLRAGAVPFIIPPVLPETDLDAWCDSLLDGLDGIIFSGGADLDPACFGASPHPQVYGIDAQRDTLEIALIRRAVQTAKPFLGICRGIQSVNVALGGTLYTHIPEQLPNPLRHDCAADFPRDHLAHPVRLEIDSHLARIMGDTTVSVNSMHHQGILDIAPALRPVGFAPDGLIEAIEVPQHPFGLAVQWHPEALPQQPQQAALFVAFAQAAARHAAS